MKFGTDGVRGRANVEVTVDDAVAIGRAAAQVLGGSTAVIGGDTRVSTAMLEAAVVAGLASAGVDVVRLGVVPTPAVAFAAAELGAFGVMVSASHNPFHDNGIKLFGSSGTKLSEAQEGAIEALLVGVPTGSGAVDPGSVRAIDIGHDYRSHLLAAIEGRTLRDLAIIVDAANGSGSAFADSVLTLAGARVTAINDQPDGRNINAGCGATHPQMLAERVRADGADLGLALDGDADRLIAVDHTGAIVDGDQILAICARDLRDRGRLDGDTVVVTVMSNLGFRVAMSEAGIEVIETPVGDRWVLEALVSGGFALGGEQSGHIIFGRDAPTGDGLRTALMLTDVVARSGRSLADLAADSMRRFPQVLLNVTVPKRIADPAAELIDEIQRVEDSLEAPSRVLVRSSGTEPLIRVMVEAPTESAARLAAEALVSAVRDRFGDATPSPG